MLYADAKYNISFVKSIQKIFESISRFATQKITHYKLIPVVSVRNGRNLVNSEEKFGENIKYLLLIPIFNRLLCQERGRL